MILEWVVFVCSSEEKGPRDTKKSQRTFFFQSVEWFYVYVCVCFVLVYTFVWVPTEARRGCTTCTPAPEVQVVVSCLLWVLGTESQSSARAASTHNYWAISAALNNSEAISVWGWALPICAYFWRSKRVLIFLYPFPCAKAVPLPEPGAHVFLASLEASHPVSTLSQSWGYRCMQDA